jgi:hypothetical protein
MLQREINTNAARCAKPDKKMTDRRGTGRWKEYLA